MPAKDDLFEGFTIGEWEVLPGHGVLRRGDQEAQTFTFSAKLRDKTLRRTLEHFVWDSQTEAVTGLTGGVKSRKQTLSYKK